MTRFLTLALVVLASAPAFAEDRSTADLSFLLGEWEVEAIFNPGAENERRESGVRVCAYVFNRRYIYCENTMTMANGSDRKLASYHNFNEVYGVYETLWINERWPIKVLAKMELQRDGDGRRFVETMEFPLPDGRIERVRNEAVVTAGTIETKETISLDGEEWRANYEERVVRK